jgi:hypothetical protein
MVRHIRSVGQKAAGVHKKPVSINNRKPIPGGQIGYLASIRCEEHVGQLKDGACALYICESAFEIAGSPTATT